MLFNPKWEQETKANPTLAGFIAWLETQDPSERYRWRDEKNCAIGRYVQHLGYKGAEDIPWLQYHALEGGNANVAQMEPHTFGAALERARAVTSTECGKS